MPLNENVQQSMEECSPDTEYECNYMNVTQDVSQSSIRNGARSVLVEHDPLLHM